MTGFSTLTATPVNVNCYGGSSGSATANPSGGTSGYTYSWSGGQTSQTISNKPAGVYTVTVTDANSCTATATATITQPTAALSVSTQQTDVSCYGQNTGIATANPSGGTSGYTYQWTGGATTQTISNKLAGSYTVTVTDSKGCTTTTTVVITQPASPPALPVVTSPVTYCQNAVPSPLSATGSNLLWYNVSTGGTGFGTAPTPNTAISGTTIYYVSQTLGGCESSRASINVVVNSIPAYPTVSSPVNYCQYATASQLSATGSNLLWYTVPSGGTSFWPAPTPSTTTLGTTTYYVSQTVNGCEGARASINVVISAPPAIPTVTSPVTYCQNATASQLSATGSNLLWYTVATGGTGSTTVPTPVTSTVGTTTYYVSQTVNGCEGARTNIDVIINATPTSPTVTSPVSYCQNATASPLSASGSNLLWYTVATGGTGSGTAPTPITSNIGTTTYYVSQTLNSCESPRASISVVITTTPGSAGTITGTSLVCQGQNSVTYTVPTIANASSYIWTLPTGATGTSNINSIIVNYSNTAAAGNITVKGHNVCGDGTVSSLSITVVPKPNASAGNDSTICPGTSIILSATGGNTYTWNNGVTQGVSFTPTSTATYTVTVSNGFCTVTDSVKITIATPPPAPVIYQVGNDLNSTSPTGNQWYNDAGIITGATSQSYTPTATSHYFVIVTDSIGCISDTSNVMFVIYTGFSNIFSNNEDIFIYPNPVANELIIEIANNKETVNFEIYNSIGQVVFNSSLIQKTVIQTNNFAKGVYLIKLENKKIFEFKKIVKE